MQARQWGKGHQIGSGCPCQCNSAILILPPPPQPYPGQQWRCYSWGWLHSPASPHALLLPSRSLKLYILLLRIPPPRSATCLDPALELQSRENEGHFYPFSFDLFKLQQMSPPICLLIGTRSFLSLSIIRSPETPLCLLTFIFGLSLELHFFAYMRIHLPELIQGFHRLMLITIFQAFVTSKVRLLKGISLQPLIKCSLDATLHKGLLVQA